jgi:hypothetical protein
MIWRANILDVLVSLIMRFPISFSIFDLFILKHDAHDRVLVSRVYARVRARLRACVRARVRCEHHHVDHDDHASTRQRNLFNHYPFKSVKMSLWVFSRARSVHLVSVRLFFAATRSPLPRLYCRACFA